MISLTDFTFESDEVEDPEIVSEFSIDDYEKYRLKSSEITIDLSLVDLEDRDEENYIKERKSELAENETDVPHPYKPEKTSEKNEQDIVEFEEDPVYGKGFANPEYELVPKNGDKISRYLYIVTWRVFNSENKLAEIEIYLPENNFSSGKALEIAQSLELR